MTAARTGAAGLLPQLLQVQDAGSEGWRLCVSENWDSEAMQKAAGGAWHRRATLMHAFDLGACILTPQPHVQVQGTYSPAITI